MALRLLISMILYATLVLGEALFDGEWVIATAGGPRPFEATIAVNAGKVSGKVKLGNGEVVSILSGNAAGDRISFWFPGQDKRKLYLSGSRSGEVIEMTLSWGPNEPGSPFTAKRK